MPDVDITHFETMNHADLEAARQTLINEAGTNYDAWSDEQLSKMAAICGVLRRKASGPPKEKKPRATKAAKATLDDLA